MYMKQRDNRGNVYIREGYKSRQYPGLYIAGCPAVLLGMAYAYLMIRPT